MLPNPISSPAARVIDQLKRLVEPVETVHQSAERLRARFLATLFLLSAVLVIAFLPARYFLDSTLANSVSLALVALVSGLLLLIPYRLAVQGQTRWANRSMLLIVTFLIFGLAFQSDLTIITRTLNYLLLLVLFASHFSTIQFTITISAIQVVGILVLFLPRMSLIEVLIGPVAFHVSATLVTVLFAYYRGRIEAERQATLAQSEARYRNVLERMPIYSYSFHRDSENNLIKEWVTESFRTITGYTWEEVVGLGVKPLYHPEDVERQEADAQRAYQEPTEAEYRIITKDGRTRWIHLLRYSVRDPEHGERLLSYGIGQDITERKQAEDQQMRAVLQRERLVLMNDFVQAISHDFRTSLATIETSRYLLQRGLGDGDREKAQPRLNVIQHYVFHMEEQLENLRAIAALADMKLEPCDLNELANQVIGEQSLRARQHHHHIIFEAEAQLPSIRADSQELGRAIKHVLVNALSYMEAEGRVTVRTFSIGQKVGLQIQDTGIGIAPEHLPHIFDLFYRAESARPLDSGGVGLGLSIVRMIVEAHGGSVKMDSVPNEGSTFTLYLPLPDTWS